MPLDKFTRPLQSEAFISTLAEKVALKGDLKKKYIPCIQLKQ